MQLSSIEGETAPIHSCSKGTETPATGGGRCGGVSGGAWAEREMCCRPLRPEDMMSCCLEDGVVGRADVEMCVMCGEKTVQSVTVVKHTKRTYPHTHTHMHTSSS